MAGPVQRIRQYYHETVSETKKATWPSKDDLIESTLVVILFTLLIALFIFGVDKTLQYCIQGLIRLFS